MSDTASGQSNLTPDEPVSRPVRLKEARESAGLHIAALAAALKVPVRKLEALEAGRYSELPDMTFARALAASACRQLKVDAAPILQQIPLGTSPKLGDHGHALNAPFNSGRDDEPLNPLSWLSRPALLASIVLLLGALVIVFMPRAEIPPPATIVAEPVTPEPVVVAEPVSAQEPAGAAAQEGVVPVSNDTPPQVVVPARTDALAVPAEASIAAAQAVATPAPPGAAPDAGALLSIVATGESWVEVVNGSGNVVAKRLLQVGDVIDFSAAPPYSVVLGKADAAQVSVRGKPFDTAPFARSNVARFEVK